MIVNKTVEDSDHNGELKKVEEDGIDAVKTALLKHAYFQC